eukprot:UN4295
MGGAARAFSGHFSPFLRGVNGFWDFSPKPFPGASAAKSLRPMAKWFGRGAPGEGNPPRGAAGAPPRPLGGLDPKGGPSGAD